MKRWTATWTLAAAALVGAAGAQTTTAPKAGDDASPEVRKLLGQQEQAAEKYATIRAEIDYEVTMPMTGDTERRTGWVAYQRATGSKPARFRVHFETLRLGGGRRYVPPHSKNQDACGCQQPGALP